jgi:hypothetical protein
MENYKLHILGMSEVRWDSFGEIATQNGFTFPYSGYNADEGPVHRDGEFCLYLKKYIKILGFLQTLELKIK